MSEIPRFERGQIDRTLAHPKVWNGGERGDFFFNDSVSSNGRDRSNGEGESVQRVEDSVPSTHSFVICADTQYGMLTDNEEWETELEYSRKAVQFMNGMNPRPTFCCVCGDLTDMDRSFEVNKKDSKFTMEECDEIQLQQRRDFKRIWSKLHGDIALVCLCGNHDVGNRPTKEAMRLYKKEFGDDYLAFWSAPNVYNIFLNTTLFSDPSGDETTEAMQRHQFGWLEERLRKCRSNDDATIFVFGHHPWFLYDENEEASNMTGGCEWKGKIIPDSYFIIPIETRRLVMNLFREYNVAAYFGGHFHQNLVSETSFGMKMIITGPLSAMLESSEKKRRQAEIAKRGNDKNNPLLTEPETLGLRVVEVSENGSFRHEFISI